MPPMMRRRRSRTALSELPAPRDNPGNLRALCHVPAGVTGPMPLVVVLHGCTQDAAGYDRGAGWSRLADKYGFALLFPEQQQANNPMRCFNWFTAGDTQRGMGEAASIRAMVETMRTLHDIDPRRIFVTGLSAGGAMASVMLATYPELFAGGAIIAGVAYGCASGVAQAFDCMGGRASADAAELGARVRRASPHKGPWPRISVWQGSADRTVVPSNADAIVLQWTHLHGLPPRPSRTETVEGLSAAGLDRVRRAGAGRALCDHRHGPRNAARPRHRRGRIRRGRRPYDRRGDQLHRPDRRLFRHRARSSRVQGREPRHASRDRGAASRTPSAADQDRVRQPDPGRDRPGAEGGRTVAIGAAPRPRRAHRRMRC